MIHAPWHYAYYGKGIAIYDPCVILNPNVIELRNGVRIDSFTKVEGGQGVVIGENVHIASGCHINAGGGVVHLGDHSGYASHVVICGGAADISQRFITPQDGNSPKRMETIIGDYAIVFAHAVILPGVTIGEGAVIAAGAVVSRNVEPWTIVAGVPALPMGHRTVRIES